MHKVVASPRRGRQSGPGACYRCGRAHGAQLCMFRNEDCIFCRNLGHIEKVCHAKKRAEGKNIGKGIPTRDTSIKELEEKNESEEEGDRLQWGSLYGIADKSNGKKQWKTGKPMFVEVIVNEQPLQMELDTGAAVSILPYEEYKKRFQKIPLQKTGSRLKTYTGELVRPQGQIEVMVKKGKVSEQLVFMVVDGPGPPQLGRNWLLSIAIEWSTIKSMTMEGKGKHLVQMAQRLKALLGRFPKTTQQKLGTVAGTRAIPVFVKAIPVP